MKAYQVQFSLPCEKPEDNIKIIRRKTIIIFEVPVNLPELHNVGYSQLLEFSERAALRQVINMDNNNTGVDPYKVQN